MDPYELFRRIPVFSLEEQPSAIAVLDKQGPDFTLQGKTILVTGGSSGIGLETVRAFASRGAKVFVAGNDVEGTKKALDDIAKTYPNHGGLEFIYMDLSSMTSVNTGADEFLARTSELNILVCNAGVLGIPYTKTKDGFEFMFGMNYLAHFLLFKRVVSLLLKSSTSEFQSRVVTLSSNGHKMSTVDLNDLHWTTRGYDMWKSYGQSKLANLYMAIEIDRRFGSQGLHAWGVHPGVILTPLAGNTPIDEWLRLGFFDKHGDAVDKELKLKNTSQGAATTIWAATSKELEGKGGKYCEDCGIGLPEPETNKRSDIGFVPHAYDYDAARQLWEYSEKIVEPFLSH